MWQIKTMVMEFFFTLMLAWAIVYLATRKGSSRTRSNSGYERERIRRSNRRFWQEERKRNKKFKDGLYDMLWGSNKTL